MKNKIQIRENIPNELIDLLENVAYFMSLVHMSKVYKSLSIIAMIGLYIYK